MKSKILAFKPNGKNYRYLLSMVLALSLIINQFVYFFSGISIRADEATDPTEIVAEHEAGETPEEPIAEEPAEEVTPAEEPVEEVPAEEPVEEVPAEEPVEEVPAEEPVEEVPAEAPVEEVPTEAPVEEVPAEEPVEEVPAEPMEEEVIEPTAAPTESDVIAEEEVITEEESKVEKRDSEVLGDATDKDSETKDSEPKVESELINPEKKDEKGDDSGEVILNDTEKDKDRPMDDAVPAPVLGGGNTTYTCGSYTLDKHNTIDWTDVTAPAGYTLVGYNYEVVDDPINDYDSGNGYTRFVAVGNNTQVTGNFGKGYGLYIVRVNAQYTDATGNIVYSDWSNECAIQYLAEEPTVDLEAPTNIRFITESGENLACGAQTEELNVTVLWNEVTDAVQYEYSVEYSATGENGTWGAPWTKIVTDHQYNGSFAPNGYGHRRIKVRAIDADGNTSDWSTYCNIEYVEGDNEDPYTIDINIVDPGDCDELLTGTATASLGVAQVVITLTNIDTDEVLVFNANLSDPGADATDFSLNVSTLSGQFNVVSEVIDTNGNTSSINTNLDRLNCNEDPEPEPEPEPEDPQPEDPEPIIPPIDGDEYPQCVETWTVDAIGMEIYNGADYSSTPQVIGHPDGGVYSINNGNGVVGRFSQPLKNIEGADFYVYNVNSNPSQNQVATVMVSDDGVSDFYAVGTISNTGNSGSPLMATGFDIESTGLDEINYVFVYVNGGEGSKFLIDAIGTGCGKQYYVSASSGGSDSVENTSEPERCEDEAPNAAPELFRIDVTDTTATLYFTPHGKPFNKIYISYWREGYPENEYGIEYDYTNDGGVTSYTINHLDPNTTYNFKVRLGNGCAPGPWGNIMQATTYGSAQYSQNDNGEVLGYTVTYKDYEQGYLADTGRNMMMSINISIVLIWAIIMLNLDYISDIFRKMFSKIKKISGTA